jgi:formate/nitrite transporter FocA (FNT family)
MVRNDHFDLNAHKSAKAGLALLEELIPGILCNTLVCLAVWLSYAGRRVSGKVPAIIFPITAFVALRFEH